MNCAIRFESEVIGNNDSSMKGFTFKTDYSVIKTVIKEWKMFCSYEFIAPYSVFNEYETLTNCSGRYNATNTFTSELIVQFKRPENQSRNLN
jgi:hypothetical protein